jgi:antitoxin ParD1/3/4
MPFYGIDAVLEKTMALNISLPPELEAQVRKRVESGLYGSASEVVREALRLFETYEQLRGNKLAQLRADINDGLADIRAGKVVDFDPDTIKQRGRARLAKHAAKK